MFEATSPFFTKYGDAIGDLEATFPFFTLLLGVASLGGTLASREDVGLILGICFFCLVRVFALPVFVDAFVRTDLSVTILGVPSVFFFLPLLPFEVVAAVASSRCDFERGTVRLDRATIVSYHYHRRFGNSANGFNGEYISLSATRRYGKSGEANCPQMTVNFPKLRSTQYHLHLCEHGA